MMFKSEIIFVDVTEISKLDAAVQGLTHTCQHAPSADVIMVNKHVHLEERGRDR